MTDTTAPEPAADPAATPAATGAAETAAESSFDAIPEPPAPPAPGASAASAAGAATDAAEAIDAAAPADATPASASAEVAPASPATPAAPVAPAKVEKPRTPEQRARRGASIGGAIGLPLATAGIVMLAVPLAVWYLNTIIRTIAVVVANAVSGKDAAQQTNDTLASIEPNAVSSFTLALAIVGAAFLIAGVLVSIFVLRAHGVHRYGMVTAIALPVGLVVATILSASIGALGGLLFGTSDTVGQILANAAFGIALSAIGSVIVTVAAGALVWPVVARAFRDPAKDAIDAA